MLKTLASRFVKIKSIFQTTIFIVLYIKYKFTDSVISKDMLLPLGYATDLTLDNSLSIELRCHIRTYGEQIKQINKH